MDKLSQIFQLKKMFKKGFPSFVWKKLCHLKLRYKYEEQRKSHHCYFMTSKETVEYILCHNCSVARFGDGELKIMDHLENLGFQKGSEELQNALFDVFFDTNPNLLVCFPESVERISSLKKSVQNMWIDYFVGAAPFICDLIKKSPRIKYGNASVTRPYIDFRNDKNAKKIFPLLKLIWQDKDIILLEGEQTRLGVGNDLFAKAKSIKRILGPSQNAFAYRKMLIEKVQQNWNGELVLLALGPTATVLAADFAKLGITAIDVGHVDIEYDWFLRKATQKIAIPGKYVNEVKSVHFIDDVCNRNYQNQIIDRVK